MPMFKRGCKMCIMNQPDPVITKKDIAISLGALSLTAAAVGVGSTAGKRLADAIFNAFTNKKPATANAPAAPASTSSGDPAAEEKATQ